ncbi:MAG: hypothetical protein ABIP06_11810 [Pyrinomonadaceae bacterium]
MKKILFLTLLVLFAVNAFAQKNEKSPDTKKDQPKNLKSDDTPLQQAKAALKAHGGDNFKNMKTLVVRGTADVSGSPTTSFPATFAMIIAGERYLLEISNPFQPFKQVYDGQQTTSSVNNFTLPPINRLGLPLLQKIETENFTVSALPEKYKKKKGFRVTSPEGFYTDFFTDEKTGQIKSYEAAYEYNGRNITTSVEIDKLLEVKGVLIPERYAQRFDLGQLTIYSNFKAREILVDTEIADDVFSVSK